QVGVGHAGELGQLAQRDLRVVALLADVVADVPPQVGDRFRGLVDAALLVHPCLLSLPTLRPSASCCKRSACTSRVLAVTPDYGVQLCVPTSNARRAGSATAWWTSWSRRACRSIPAGAPRSRTCRGTRSCRGCSSSCPAARGRWSPTPTQGGCGPATR